MKSTTPRMQAAINVPELQGIVKSCLSRRTAGSHSYGNFLAGGLLLCYSEFTLIASCIECTKDGDYDFQVFALV